MTHQSTKDVSEILDVVAQLVLSMIVRLVRTVFLVVRTPNAIVRTITADNAGSRLLHPIPFALLTYVIFCCVLDIISMPSGDMRFDPGILESAIQLSSTDAIIRITLPLLCWVGFVGWIISLVFHFQLDRAGLDKKVAINRGQSSKAWLRLVFILSGLHFSALSLMLALATLLFRFEPFGSMTSIIVILLFFTTFVLMMLHTIILPQRVAPIIFHAYAENNMLSMPRSAGFVVAVAAILLLPGYVGIGIATYSSQKPYLKIVTESRSEDVVLSLNILITNRSSRHNLLLSNIIGPTIEIGKCTEIRQSEDNIVSIFFNKFSVAGMDEPEKFLLEPGASVMATITWEQGLSSGYLPNPERLEAIQNWKDDFECCCRVKINFLQPSSVQAVSQWKSCRPNLN